MSEAKSGAGVAFVPGCRFAHPGYDMHLVAMTILQDCHCQRLTSEPDRKSSQRYRALPNSLKMSPSWPGLTRPSTSFLHDGARTWMPGTRPGMTAFAIKRYFIGCFLSETDAAGVLSKTENTAK